MSEQGPLSPSPTAIIVGVDTHKYVHVAVAIDRPRYAHGELQRRRPTAPGTRSCVSWARTLGTIEAFGIEGTGSYGVGLASYVRRQAIRVSSRSVIAIAASAATTARVTPWMRRPRLGPFWPDSRPPFQSPLMARPKWFARSKSRATRR